MKLTALVSLTCILWLAAEVYANDQGQIMVLEKRIGKEQALRITKTVTTRPASSRPAHGLKTMIMLDTGDMIVTSYDLVLQDEKGVIEKSSWNKENVLPSKGISDVGVPRLEVFDMARQGENIFVLFSQNNEIRLSCVPTPTSDRAKGALPATEVKIMNEFGATVRKGAIFPAEKDMFVILEMTDGNVAMLKVCEKTVVKLWSEKRGPWREAHTQPTSQPVDVPVSEPSGCPPV